VGVFYKAKRGDLGRGKEMAPVLVVRHVSRVGKGGEQKLHGGQKKGKGPAPDRVKRAATGGEGGEPRRRRKRVARHCHLNPTGGESCKSQAVGRSWASRGEILWR